MTDAAETEAPIDESWLESLHADDWNERLRAVTVLADLEPAGPMVLALEQREQEESDPDVRAAITIALADAHADERGRTAFLVKRLADDLATVRLAAAVALMRGTAPDAHASGAGKVLWKVCREEEFVPVQAALCKVLASTPSPSDQIAQASLSTSDAFRELRAAILLRQLLDGHVGQQLADRALEAAGRVAIPSEAHELDMQALSWAEDPAQFVEAFISRHDVSDYRVTALITQMPSVELSPDQLPDAVTRVSGALIEAPEAVGWPSDPFGFQAELVGEAMEGVSWEVVTPPEWPNDAVEWLEEHKELVVPGNLDLVVAALFQALGASETAGHLLVDLLGVKGLLDNSERGEGSAIGRALLKAEAAGNTDVRDLADESAQFVIALANHSNPEDRFQAVTWLGMRARDLNASNVQAASEALRASAENMGEYNEIRNAARAAVIELEESKRKESLRPLVEKMSSGDEEKALQALEELDKLDSFDAARAMVDQWVRWIPVRERTSLVEAAAERLRRKANAVLPLLEHLLAPPALTRDTEQQIREEMLGPDLSAILENFGGGKLDAATRARFEPWILALPGGAEAAATIAAGRATRETLESCVHEEVLRRFPGRQQHVRRRLARHLSEMSEERFFTSAPAEHQPVLDQLRMHAVSMLGRNLTGEEDVEVRESVARTLASLGGREAVDALSRAVAGEERTSRRRQELLARYYLDPSKEQSDQAAKLLNEAVVEAKRTLRILQVLNFVFAGIGLASLASGLVILLRTTEPQLQIAGGAISVAALFGLIFQAVREPLDRIQGAMNKLVQVETAFTSFIWELNLNSTYIQSQYVARGVLLDDEVASTVDRIESAMRLSMDLVTTYAGDGLAKARPELAYVVPAQVRGGDSITIGGTWLGKPSGHRIPGGSVYLNHRPSEARVVTWTDAEVQVKLPDDVSSLLRDGAAGPVWLSLLVAGRETNSVALHLGT